MGTIGSRQGRAGRRFATAWAAVVVRHSSRHQRCGVWMRSNHDDQRCEGRITFQARSIQSGSWLPIVMSDDVRTAIETHAQFMAAQRR